MNKHFERGARAGIAIAALAALAVLGGCASPGQPITPEAQARAVAARPAAPTAEEWPDPGAAKWKQGTFPNLDNVRKMAPGMGKDQVRELLGWPHFSEGLWGVKEWNYIFHLRTTGSEYKTCQYMVRYDDTPLVIGAWWKTVECSALANPPAITPIIPAQTTLMPPQKVSLSADGLFRFDGSRPDDLLPEGRERIARLASEIRANFKVLHYITVTGHTDRLGTDAYNQTLSQARADTVRGLLLDSGLDRAKVRAVGMGKRQPLVTDCEGTRATPELVKCLQPNRRVEIEVVGGN
ncbi:MAG: OmpA family protein [Rhodocyclaceae bacterium]|nr:OmpA family protein [Pseudomonadota bacterium]MDQ7974011.1 OmpA family protein [Rhodocyclaceae bacterium]MDQ8001729.1 OmpA family protein [Pseudomonadota bacterium]MDQ8019666.1 OmpA family protein [Pseudomonadota bacterium]